MTLREIRARAQQQLSQMPHAQAAGAFLSTAPGQEFLSHLEAEFLFGDLAGDTPEQTAFNLGAREVVLYLRRLRILKERTEGQG